MSGRSAGCRGGVRGIGVWVRALALVAGFDAGAAAPTLEHLWPAGGMRGTTNLVTLSGKFDPWPVRFHVQGEGVTFQARTNSGKVDVVVASDAIPGPRLVRAYGDEGASEPRFFVVHGGAGMADTEPNDRWVAPQSIPGLPMTVEGRLDRAGDVDSFAFELVAGQWLEARLEAFVLMGKIDAVLRLVDTRGVQRAWNHDALALDPRLVWQAPESGRVVVQVFGFRYPADASVTLGGGEGSVYRLHLSAATERPRIFPEGARSENETAMDAPGAEPGRRLELPVVAAGTVDPGTDTDRYGFRAANAESLVLEVQTLTLGSPLDAWIRVEDAAGKELAFADDSGGGRDPRLEWKAPEAGDYVAVVGSRSHRGGPDHAYGFTIRRSEAGFQGRTSAGAFVVEAGSTNTVKIPVTVTRSGGHTNGLEITVRGLPPGVTAAPLAVPAAGGEVPIPLVVADDATAFQGPFRVVVAEAVSGRERAVAWDLVSAGENNGVPQGWSRLVIERTEELWLTVRPRAAK